MQDSAAKSSDYIKLLSDAEEAAQALIYKLKGSFTLALAESCTAGLVSSLLANAPGASSVLWGSFVCYTQEAKVSMLGLDNGKLSAYGLVSRETAADMANMALQKSGCEIAASVTGIAGPQGDGSDTPVGTVWVAAARRGGILKEKVFCFDGDRNEVRLKAAIAVIEIIQSILT
jgi:PncC family amidohydrolase